MGSNAMSRKIPLNHGIQYLFRPPPFKETGGENENLEVGAPKTVVYLLTYEVFPRQAVVVVPHVKVCRLTLLN